MSRLIPSVQQGGHALLYTFALIYALAASPAAACTATVDADDGIAALQAALDAAVDGDEVCVTPGVSGVIPLASAPIDITSNIRLTGPGSELLTVDAGSATRALQIGLFTAVTDVTVSGLTLLNGSTLGGNPSCNSSSGGGVLIRSTTAAGFPGAVLEDVVVEGSECEGVRIQTGNATLLRSVVRNSNPGPGVVVASGGGVQRIVESALVGNVATVAGGGLVSSLSNAVVVINSTISGNSAKEGGGLHAVGGPLDVYSSTITDNIATTNGGGGIATGFSLGGGPVTLHNSIVGGNSPDDCKSFNANGTFTGNDHNLFEDLGGCPAAGTDLSVPDAATELAALSDNGGPTQTHALTAGSVAVDAGAVACADDGAALAVDQRGAARSVGAACDIGAHESGPPIANVAPLAHDFGSVPVGDSEMTLVTISNDGNDTLAVSGLALAGSADFAGILPPTLLTLHFDDTSDVELSYTPSSSGVSNATFSVTSDGSAQRVDVALSGEGVSIDPTPQLQDLLDFVDTSLDDGSLFGVGPGNSSVKRPKAFRNKIEAAGDLIASNLIDEACEQLLDVRNRADGDRKPPDFVGGPAAAEVVDHVDALRSEFGCS